MAPAVLSTREEAGSGLLLVGIDVAPHLARAYERPGQYVEVKTERGNGYFVLAGPPRASRWELLVRNAGEAADALHVLPLGAALDVSPPLGAGFPIDDARERPLVVAVVGSALAVARPVMEVRIAESPPGSTFLYVGVRAARDVPLLDEVRAWSEAGVRVVVCLSQAELEHVDPEARVLPEIAREAGYVQRVLELHFEAARVPREALVVAAGPQAMLDELRLFGRTRGIEIVTNV